MHQSARTESNCEATGACCTRSTTSIGCYLKVGQDPAPLMGIGYESPYLVEHMLEKMQYTSLDAVTG